MYVAGDLIQVIGTTTTGCQDFVDDRSYWIDNETVLKVVKALINTVLVETRYSRNCTWSLSHSDIKKYETIISSDQELEI